MLNAAKAHARFAVAGLRPPFSAARRRPAQPEPSKTVKQRGALHCGVGEGLFGFSEQDSRGEWSTSTSTSVARS